MMMMMMIVIKGCYMVLDILTNNWFGFNTFSISNNSSRVLKSELMISIEEYRPIGRKV